MRVAIVNLTGGGLSGGSKKYLQNMIPRFAELNNGNILCLSPEGTDVSAWFDDLIAVEYGSCRPLSLVHFANMPDGSLARHLKRFSPDILFLPVDRYIRFNDVPVVNMMRNMEPFVPNLKGDSAQERIRKFIQRKLAHNSVRRADHTIAVSDFVRNYLVAGMKVPENKITKVYHGLALQPSGRSIRPLSIPAGWKDGFVFTSGSIRPARGLEDAVYALDAMKRRGLDVRLVIAGEAVPGMSRYLNDLKALVVSKELATSVCWAGLLSDEEVRWCFDHCGSFIMTSRVEACPNTAMEAMLHGAISIVADNPPLPEFFSNCAAYYRPGSGESLAEAVINQLGLGPGDRLEISDRARRRSSIFSWDLTAEKTMGVLMQTLERAKRGPDYS